MDDFKKKLEDLAQTVIEKNQVSEKKISDLVIENKRIETDAKAKFSQKVREIIIPYGKDMRDIFENRDLAKIRIYTNDLAQNLEDKVRSFVQILYYPKGKSPALVALNTPSILFELIPAKATVLVKEKDLPGSKPFVVIDEIKIDAFDESIIKTTIMNFLDKVAVNP